MDRPLDIGFHNMDPSPAIEAEIREKVGHLERRYAHLTGCRVTVEALHNQHRTGNVYEVHVTLSVPGRDLAVSREPHHAKDRYAHADIHTSLRDAFHAAERQLESYKGRLRTAQPDPGETIL
jgi:ribosome-associated translation inhibitor RaiA